MINTAYTKVPKPYKHQIDAFKFIKDKDHFALFMEQGTGKTKVVLMKLKYLYNKGLVDSAIIIVPNAIKYQWLLEQIPEHYGHPFTGIIWDGFKSNKKKDEFYKVVEATNILRVFIVNIEAFQSNSIDFWMKAFCKTSNPFIIIDESTRIKNPDAIRTTRILKGFKKRKYKAILTGTPTPNSPFDLFSQFNFLKEDYFGKISFFQFKHHHGIMMTKKNEKANKNYTVTLNEEVFSRIKRKLNSLKLNNEINEHTLLELAIKNDTTVKNIVYINNLSRFTPYKNIDQLNQTISKDTYKVMKKDCLDLPDKVYEVLHAELSPTQKKLYKSLQKELKATYNGRELSVSNKMVMAMRLHMITGGNFPFPELEIKKMVSKETGEVYEGLKTTFETEPIKENAKLKVLIEDLEEVSSETQIIVWSRFVGEIKTITAKLNEAGYPSKAYYGGVPEKERPVIIQGFKDRQFRILVMNPVVGGEGLNLQVSTLHYFFSNSYRADARLQGEDRSHRIGQENKVTYKDIVALNTVDEKILKAMQQKINLIDYFRNSSLDDIIY